MAENDHSSGFHSLNLSCSIKECKTVRADITVTDRMEKNQIQMII